MHIGTTLNRACPVGYLQIFLNILHFALLFHKGVLGYGMKMER